MPRLGAIADRLLALVVPRRSAAAYQCPCSPGYTYPTCYCSGGLRYMQRCWTYGDPFCCDVACTPCFIGGTC